jgi:hypothetical protein
MIEKEINGQTYTVGKLDPFAQLHVARRLAPVLASMGVGALALARGNKLEAEAMLDMLGPVSEIVAKMPEEDVNYILQACLMVCKRHQADKKASVMVNGQLMFQDMEMPTLMQLAVAVVKESLGGFFSMLPSADSN